MFEFVFEHSLFPERKTDEWALYLTACFYLLDLSLFLSNLHLEATRCELYIFADEEQALFGSEFFENIGKDLIIFS